jgi:hypothetical protein
LVKNVQLRLGCAALQQIAALIIAKKKMDRMIALSLACLIGAYLGLYYSFLVLIPITLAATFAFLAGAAAHGEAISTALFTIITVSVGLQGGYMIGLTGRDLLSALVASVSSKRAY